MNDNLKYRARPETEDEIRYIEECSNRVLTLNNIAKQNGKRRNACVVTYGCQQNEADGERIAGMAKKMGYTIVDDPNIADLIVVNTCAVREHAEQKALSVTGGYKHLKNSNEDLILCLCGCMASEKHIQTKVKNSYPYVDITFATEAMWRFPELVCKVMENGKRLFVENYGDEVISETMNVERKSTYSAWVSIMYGCNNFCTYCIVPYVRGRERSRKPECIIEEIKGLVNDGYKEIVLLGQNVNSYGKEYNVTFAQLLEDICKIDGDFIIRYMSSHPKDCSPDLVRVIRDNPKIERHFHLPVQSGSSRLLKMMNRNYTREKYLEEIKLIKEQIPDVALSSDIIVGFPGETEEDFNETLTLLEEVKYDMLFNFIYSKREGTPAARSNEQIPEEVKTERFLRLVKVQEKIAEELAQRFVGKVEKVLVEGKSKTNESVYTGRNSAMKIVLFDGDDSMIGHFADIRIDEGHAFVLNGTVLKVY